MNRLRHILLLLLAMSLHASAQQDIFRSRISLMAGLDRYIGDIEQDFGDVEWTRSGLIGLNLQRSLTYGTALYGQYSFVRISANDLTNGNNRRALNFLTEAHTLELGFVFRSDNGRFLRYDARFAPFLSVGIGAGMYDVRGDLFSANGRRYHYWSDGTIRDLGEGSSVSHLAQVIEQDGDFETSLTDERTEDGKPNDPVYLFVPAKIGVKWRISDRLSADLFYGFNWTFSDHLDDIHNAYPSDLADPYAQYISRPGTDAGPRGDAATNDHYHYVGIALSWSFGRRSHAYRVTPLYVDHVHAPAPLSSSIVPLPPVPAPAPKKVVEQPQVININVERITVGRLVVDTLVVGTTIQPSSSSQKTAEPDTARRPVLLKEKIQVKDSIRVDTARSVKAVPPAIGQTVRKDSVARVQSQIVALDSLRQKPPTKTVVVDSAATRAPQVKAGTERIVPVIKPDSVKAVPSAPLVPAGPVLPGAPAVKADTVSRSPLSPNQKETGKVATGIGSNEPVVPKAKAEPEPKERPVSTVTTVVPVPVVITVPAQQDSAIVARNMVLQDSLRALADRNARLRFVADSLAKARAVPGPTAKLDSATAAELHMSQQVARHTQNLNRLLVEQVTTLERYVQMQNELANDSILLAQRMRIKELDKQVALLRDSLRMDGAQAKKPAPPVKEFVPTAPATISEPTALTDTIFFASGSKRVGEADRALLKATAARIMASKSGKVLVTGHSDRSGNAAFNLELSQIRADEVARLLVEAGVPRERIVAKGLGEQLAKSAHSERERNVVVHAVLGVE